MKQLAMSKRIARNVSIIPTTAGERVLNMASCLMKRSFTALSLVCLLGCGSDDSPISQAAPQPTMTSAATDPEISCRALTVDDQKVLEAHRIRLRELGRGSANPMRAPELDAAWTRWISMVPTNTAQVQSDVSAFGIGLGDELVRLLEFTWQYCSDQYGEGLAVVALPGRGDVTIFPEDFVAKRYERSEGRFFAEAMKQIGEANRRMRAEWDAAGSRPN
jgi:hypothetical protein